MKSGKKILVVLSRIPYPLEKGDKLRAFHQIKSLSQQHDVYLFALNDSASIHPKALEILGKYCTQIHIEHLSKIQILFNLAIGFLGNKPFQVYYFYNRKAQQAFNLFYTKIKPDAIYCQLLRTAEYVRQINDTPKTIDYQDAFAKGMERRLKNAPFLLKSFFGMEYQRLRNYENLIFHYFEHHVIITEQDRNFIIHEDNHQISIIPNGVDLDFFTPQTQTKDVDLVFTGNMSYPPNINCAVYLVQEVMPLVWQKKPAVKLLLSGTSPAQEVLQLQSDHVEVSGWVNDIRQSYARSAIFVAPMQIGTGLQNKLLEAMAMKIPCITSELANSALGGTHQENILVGRTKEDFANAIVQLLDQPEYGKQLAENAFTFVSNRYSWELHNQKLETIILSDVK